MDDDGYPTQDTLDRLASWDPADFEGLARFLVDLWIYDDAIELEGDGLRLSTGGWSGHEDVLGAVNRKWWFFHWQSSERGGHHVFRSLGARE